MGCHSLINHLFLWADVKAGLERECETMGVGVLLFPPQDKLLLSKVTVASQFPHLPLLPALLSSVSAPNTLKQRALEAMKRLLMGGNSVEERNSLHKVYLRARVESHL